MTSTAVEELSLPYDPTSLQQKVLRRRRRMRSRLISLVITLVLLAVLYAWQRQAFTGGYLVLSIALLGVSVAWFVGFLVAYVLARRELARVGHGIALRIGRPGVELAGTYVPWSEVAALRAVTRRWGRGEQLQLSRTGGEPLAVPLHQLDVRPATLDLSARAYSAGRHGIDLSQLDA